MKRYIKIDNQWVDTLESEKFGITFTIIEACVIRTDCNGDEHFVGHLQEESDLCPFRERRRLL